MDEVPNRYRLELGEVVRAESRRVEEVATVFDAARSAMERRAWDSTMARQFWEELQAQRAAVTLTVVECQSVLQARFQREPVEVHPVDPRARFRG